MLNRWLSGILIVFAVLMITALAEAEEEKSSTNSEKLVEVKNIRYSLGNGTVRVVVDLTNSTEHKIMYLNSPARMVVDIQNAKLFNQVSKQLELKSTIAKTLKVGQFNNTTVRIVIETEAKGNVFKLPGGAEGQRMVIDIGDKSTAKESTKADNTAKTDKPAEVTPPSTTPPPVTPPTVTTPNNSSESEQIAKERAELEREREKLAQERAQLEKEKQEQARLEKDRQERERLEKEKKELERLEKEKRELEKEREKIAKEREKLEREKLEKERKEKEKQEKNERERQEKEDKKKSKEDKDKNKTDSEIDKKLSEMTNLNGKKIAIDAGHGGNDAGAIGPSGVMEKTATLKVALALEKLLKDEGAEVIMTRTIDTEVSSKGRHASAIEELQSRCDVANKAKVDIFISIHMDSFTNPAAKGTTGYYYSQGTSNSKKLADCIRKALCSEIKTPSRGTQPCNFYVVKNTDMPATLIEVLFISNPAEEKFINSKEGVQKAAQGILDGIEDYFG